MCKYIKFEILLVSEVIKLPKTKQKNMTNSNTLPKDVAAYLSNAAKSLMAEQNFIPSTENQALEWMQKNAKQICERARESMQNLLCKILDKPELMQKVSDTISASIYKKLRSQKTETKFNSRYVAYALENGCTPEEMLKRDGGKMTNFLTWNPKAA